MANMTHSRRVPGNELSLGLAASWKLARAFEKVYTEGVMAVAGTLMKWTGTQR